MAAIAPVHTQREELTAKTAAVLRFYKINSNNQPFISNVVIENHQVTFKLDLHCNVRDPRIMKLQNITGVGITSQDNLLVIIVPARKINELHAQLPPPLLQQPASTSPAAAMPSQAVQARPVAAMPPSQPVPARPAAMPPSRPVPARPAAMPPSRPVPASSVVARAEADFFGNSHTSALRNELTNRVEHRNLQENQFNQFKQLIQQGASPTVKTGSKKWNLLHAAVHANDVNFITWLKQNVTASQWKYLLAAKTQSGATPVMMADARDDHALMSLLQTPHTAENSMTDTMSQSSFGSSSGSSLFAPPSGSSAQGTQPSVYDGQTPSTLGS